MAPFRVTILNLKQGSADTDAACEQLYRALGAKGIDVLYNDLEDRPGAKFATADLIGIPWRVVVGRGAASGQVELVRRAGGEKRELAAGAVRALLEAEIVRGRAGEPAEA